MLSTCARIRDHRDMDKPLPTNRDDAKRTASPTFYDGPCKHGHDSPKYTLTGQCVICSNTKDRSKHAKRV